MSTNDILRIAVIGGDGTGPEVAAEGMKVLKAVAEMEGIKYETKDFDYGGDRYLETGEILPEGAIEELGTFVLSRGSIEVYVGLGKTSKGEYLSAAREIESGERTLNFENEIRSIYLKIKRSAEYHA